MQSTITIATRKSPLALWQAKHVAAHLTRLYAELKCELAPMTTQGDQLLHQQLNKVGGKGLFLKELESSLLRRESDIAVHSMKDVPVDLPPGLALMPVLEREAPEDAWVSNVAESLEQLPTGARIGTSSLRRVAQLSERFPQFQYVPLRGNVNTRLRRLDEGEFDGIILAAAGLIRLGMQARIRQLIPIEHCLPAVGQGALGIEYRADDEETKKLIEPLQNQHCLICLNAERAFNEKLGGGCHLPVAAFARIDDDHLQLKAVVASPDGQHSVRETVSERGVDIEQARQLGRAVAETLLSKGAADILLRCKEVN